MPTVSSAGEEHLARAVDDVLRVRLMGYKIALLTHRYGNSLGLLAR